jgi:sulfide:quinone oxidoreductase
MKFPITQHTDFFATSPQISPSDMQELVALGFRTVINNRPDGEDGYAQPSSQEMAQSAQMVGMIYRYLPVVSGQITSEQVTDFADMLTFLPGPVLAFCRSGMRSMTIWRMSQELPRER